MCSLSGWPCDEWAIGKGQVLDSVAVDAGTPEHAKTNGWKIHAPVARSERRRLIAGIEIVEKRRRRHWEASGKSNNASSQRLYCPGSRRSNSLEGTDRSTGAWIDL